MMYISSPSLGYVVSTGIIPHGLSRILNHFVVFNIYITFKFYQYLCDCPRLSSYLNYAKTISLHRLFSSDMIVQDQPF